MIKKQSEKNICYKRKRIFIILSFVLFAILIITSIYFKYNKCWYGDDTFGWPATSDFFMCLPDVVRRDPYADYATATSLYPPLANLFIYISSIVINKNNISDAYFEQSTTDAMWNSVNFYSMTFVLLLIIISTLLIYIGLKLVCDKYSCINKNNLLLPLTFFISYPMNIALLKGNLIIIAFIFLLIFVYLYDNDNKYLREIALISLSISANIKITPALFGLLLVFKKDLSGILKCLLYGIILFIFPFFCFVGGINNIFSFINNALLFGNSFHYFKIGFNAATIYFDEMTGCNFHDFSKYLRIFALLFYLIKLFKENNEYKRIFNICILICFYIDSVPYTLIYFIIPFIILINRNDKCTYEKVDYIFMLMLLLPITVFIGNQYYEMLFLNIIIIIYFVYDVLLFVNQKRKHILASK